MNKQAIKLSLASTHYANPHGLVNSQNKSSAYDQAQLCAHAMSLPAFRELVGTKKYSGRVVDNAGAVRKEEWVNSNKML